MSDAGAPVAEARGVARVLPGEVPVTLVQGIDLAFDRGEFAAVTGPSGSGKSSLLYLIGLLDRPTEGRILIEGRDTAAVDERERAAMRLERLGFVFQFHFLLPEFTVIENVEIPMRRLARLRPIGRRERARAILDDLGLAPHANKRPDQLSGGERQRAAVARALANDPLIVLADEPTGNLDTRNAAAVFDIFERLAGRDGRTVIAVTHQPELAARAGRRIRLLDGRVVEDSRRTA
jgi:lipoprotein-releasing system ATP-binding protein